MSRSLRFRDILALLLLFLLHTLFTFSSLIVRLYELISHANPDESSSIRENENHIPPKHVAFVLSHPSHSRYSSLNRVSEERKAMIESILRGVGWAGEEGIEEISIWDERGRSIKTLHLVLQSARLIAGRIT